MSAHESFSTERTTTTTFTNESHDDEFDRFKDLAEKPVNVPKSEIDEKRHAEKNGSR